MKKKEEKKEKKKSYVLLVLLLLLLVSVGYAALTANLQITGTTKLKGNTWDVHLENVAGIVNNGAIVNTAPTINATADALTFDVTLGKPGDYYEFTVDVKNAGGIDAKLASVPTLTGFTAAQLELATYSITYGGTAVSSIAAGDQLASSAKKTIKVRVEFKSDIDEDDLPGTETTLNDITLQLNYVQA